MAKAKSREGHYRGRRLQEFLLPLPESYPHLAESSTMSPFSAAPPHHFLPHHFHFHRTHFLLSLFLCSVSLMQPHIPHFRGHDKALRARDDGDPRQGLAYPWAVSQTFWAKLTHAVYQGQHSGSAPLTAPDRDKGNTDVTAELWPGLLLLQ